ncbi:MAG: adenosylmethionine decarboxylase [Methylococcales bacterium]|nr:adenosylmethionine decarboxylase [Methylococcales bacterium]
MKKKNFNASGQHLIIDLYHAQNLNDLALMKTAIHEIIRQTETTLLFENFHPFQPSGITGIACLAESHISVHTWPEQHFAAFDIFMCGTANPKIAIDIIKDYFGGSEQVIMLQRGKNGR